MSAQIDSTEFLKLGVFAASAHLTSQPLELRRRRV